MSTYRPITHLLGTLALACLCTTTADASQVSNITVGRFQDFTVVTLFGDAPLTVTHQIVEAKDGKPHRIVVDITGAIHALPANNFTNLPKGSITSIRTSQFAVSPEPVVRIVMDLAHPAAYRLETPGHNVRVMLSLPGDPPIGIAWSAISKKTFAEARPAKDSKNARAKKDAQQTGAARTSPVMAVTAVKKDSEAAAKDAASKATKAASAAASTSKAAKVAGTRDGKSKTDPVTVAVAPPKAPPAVIKTVDIPKPAPSVEYTSIKLADLSDSNEDMRTVPLPMPKKRSMPKIDYQLPRRKAVLAARVPSKSVEAPAKAAESSPKMAHTPNESTTPDASAKKVKEKKAPIKAASAAPEKKAVKKATPVVVASAQPAANKPVAKKSTLKRAPRKSASTTKRKSLASANKAAAPKDAKSKRSARPAKGNSAKLPMIASEPMASLTTLPPLARATPQLVPERSKIAYHTGGRRDPFEALLAIGTGFNSAALPDVGTLRLVGLLHDVRESMGLFEDANGFGYILRKGDRVKNGRLTKLTQTRAYFQLSEFGWSRSVQLDLMKSEG